MAGIFEEVAKGVAVLLLYLAMRDEFDNVVDGIIYGAAVGLGFNFMESVGWMTHVYALYAPDRTGTAHAIGMWYWRQVIGLFLGHTAYTALIGAGIGVARQLPRAGQRLLVIPSGFLAAIAAHFAWDAWQAVTLAGVRDTVTRVLLAHAGYLFIVGPFIAILLVLLAMGLQREDVALRQQLREVAGSGSETGARNVTSNLLARAVLAFAVKLLPASRRDVFLREHIGSLAEAEGLEQAFHLIHLLVTMPWTAWVFWRKP